MNLYLRMSLWFELLVSLFFSFISVILWHDRMLIVGRKLRGCDLVLGIIDALWPNMLHSAQADIFRVHLVTLQAKLRLYPFCGLRFAACTRTLPKKQLLEFTIDICLQLVWSKSLNFHCLRLLDDFTLLQRSMLWVTKTLMGNTISLWYFLGIIALLFSCLLPKSLLLNALCTLLIWFESLINVRQFFWVVPCWTLLALLTVFILTLNW